MFCEDEEWNLERSKLTWGHSSTAFKSGDNRSIATISDAAL